MTPLKPLIQKVLPEIVRLRHHLHENPELGFQEVETAKRVAGILENLPNFVVRTGVAETGIVAVLGANKSGPCVALRADMDCLQITEETGLAYASKVPGLMHACGHDGHTSALVGAAMVLSEVRDELSGPVKFLFQPAEEGGAGAERMVAEGALDEPKVEAIFGLHNNPGSELNLGDVAFREGPFMGGGFDFQIEVIGKGGHAAAPHAAVDPIYIGAQIVNALQALASRSTNPIETLVLTIAKFHAGTATNIIPDSARLGGTVRSLQPRLLELAHERVERIATAVASAHGATANVIFRPGYPVVLNEGKAAAFLKQTAETVVGPAKTNSGYGPLLASEDFSFYQEQRPGCFFFVGSRPLDKETVPTWHQSKFDFNNDILPVAIEMHCELARRFAREWK
jgi:amidohydrolase